jgi:hypothetical protein
MLDRILAWVRSVCPELTATEQHRPVRSGHAVPVEPYATAWVAREESKGRPSRKLSSVNTLRKRELRVYSVAVDVYGAAHEELARRLYTARDLPDTLRFFRLDALSLSSAERVTHPTAQQRSTVVFRVHYCEETNILDFPSIDAVEVTP